MLPDSPLQSMAGLQYGDQTVWFIMTFRFQQADVFLSSVGVVYGARSLARWASFMVNSMMFGRFWLVTVSRRGQRTTHCSRSSSEEAD